MKLTGEFTNAAGVALMAAPYVATTVLSAGIMHPATTVAAAAIGAGLYAFRNSITSIFASPKKIAKIETTDAMRNIASAIGLKNAPDTYIVERPVKNAYAYSDAILFTQSAVDALSEEEFLSTYAHECAHIKRGDHSIRQGEITGMFAGAFGFCLSLGNGIVTGATGDEFLQQSVTTMAYASTVVVPYLTAKAYRSPSVSHRMEFDCDRREVLATGNSMNSISKLQKLYEAIGRDAYEDSKTHPSLNRRIANMRKAHAEDSVDSAAPINASLGPT